MDLERLKIDRGASAQRRRRGSRVRWLVWIVLLGILGAGTYLFRTPLLDAVDRLRLPRVEVVLAARTSPLAASAVSGTAANGYVVARHRAALSADTPGRIVEMNVEEGSVVRKGDVVARLYSEEYEAAVRRAEADLASARAALTRSEAEAVAAEAGLEERRQHAVAADARVEEARADRHLAELNHARSQRLAEDRVVSVQRVDDTRAEIERTEARVTAALATAAEANSSVVTGERNLAVAHAVTEEVRSQLAVLEAARDLAQATLEKTEVRAPFDGVVVLKDAEVGEVVSPNSLGGNSRGSVATMVDFDSLEVQVEVPETSLSAVAIGASAAIYLDAFPDRRYTGQVQRIWPTANRQKATVEVRVGFDETDELLRPEMGARVVFSSADGGGEDLPETPANAILLPANCIVRVDGETGVFLLERDVARFRVVRRGEDSGTGRVLIEEGLQGGERIVSDPPPSLDDGDRVRTED